ITAEEQQFIEAEIARSLSPAQFAAAARTPEQRAEVYLASALAVDADTEAERAYLKYLAATLALDDKLIAHLEDAVRTAKADVGPAVQS
ncbi:tellurite resistance TerB family protein, partial [Microbacteriaceae bacterium K1510]|nr:tellurite resistance TerB family protein [Microbacteriaceae bacterium K1510]